MSRRSTACGGTGDDRRPYAARHLAFPSSRRPSCCADPGLPRSAPSSMCSPRSPPSLAGVSLLLRRRRGRRLRHRRRRQHRLHRPQHAGRLHDVGVQRQLYRPRDRDRPAHAAVRALLSRHVPGDDGLDEPGAHRQQHRRDVGRPGTGDADHRGHGRHLPHARRRSRRRGNISSSAASAFRSPSSAPSSSISPARRRWARVCRR